MASLRDGVVSFGCAVAQCPACIGGHADKWDMERYHYLKDFGLSADPDGLRNKLLDDEKTSSMSSTRIVAHVEK